jgi:fibronectin type 3 domain-containing protein/peptidoglycan/xylan/chitin deacetylase (PgdA/CDA1 family)
VSAADEWQPYTAYTVGDIVSYQGVLYECRQSHTSLPGWEPPNVLALWLPIEGEAPPPEDTTPPAAPTGLTATAVSSSQIDLSWNANTESDLASYSVYRSTTSGFTPGAGTFVISTTSSSYSDTGLSASTTYYYKVTAVDTSGNESSPSAQASATTQSGAAPPPPPTGGWDFECHSYTHPQAITTSELQKVNDSFQKYLGYIPDHHAYPYGNVNESVCRQYRLSGRTISGIMETQYPVPNWYQLKATEIQSGTAWSTIQGWVDQAISQVGLLTIFSHRVADPAPQYGMTPAMLNQLLDYLVTKQNAGQLTVLPIKDAYNAWNGTSPIVVLTFDDGWLTDYTNTWPAFKEHGLVGTSYIYPQPMDEMWTEFMSWAQVQEMAGLREARPAPGPSVTRAGVRESTYGPAEGGWAYPSAGEWTNYAETMASYWSGSQPTLIWLVGIMDVPIGSDMTLQFPNPTGQSYPNISFESTDLHESYLDYFDTHGIDVWLQVEPAFADMNTLIDLVLDQYGHHSCVKGFGLDCEWYKYSATNNEGVPITDAEAQAWEARVKSHSANYTLFLKHYNYNWLPPTYRGDIIFVSDSQDFNWEELTTPQDKLDALVYEATIHWAPWFYPNPVWFQIGYESDKNWWQTLANPPKNIGDAIDAGTTQATGIFWVDFTLGDVFTPPAGDTTPPAAPTGLTATAVSSSRIDLSWNANTESDLASYSVYRSTTSGFTPGTGTFVTSTTVSNYSDTGLSASTTYYYKVTAVDTSGNESGPSAQASATTEAGVAAAVTHAGIRSSTYGAPSPFPSAEEWTNDMNIMASYWPGSQPTALWLVGVMESSDVLGSTCHLEFPEPAGGPYTNITFESTDLHESYFDYFDTHGIDVWLQVEPGDADVGTLIDLVLDQYGHHSCVKGFGLDVEWYTTTGASVTDSDAQTWESRVKSHNSSYTLFIKFWNIDRTPPSYRGDIIFVNDSQEFTSLSAMVDEFANYWAPEFYPNPVWFQYGYEADRSWWETLDNPPKDIGDAIDAAVPQDCGLFWVDFTMRDVFPAVADTTPPAAPTGLTATAVSSSQINLSWNANTESDLASYSVYRSTTSGFTPGAGTFVTSTTSSSYSDTGLSASTTYYYKVTAVDTSGNESSPSAQASATTQSGAAPPEAPEWQPYTAYTVGDVVSYEGTLYECRQSHTSLPGWEPPNVPALWLPI